MEPKNPAGVTDGSVQPVRQNELQAQGLAGGSSKLLPLVDPGEAVHPAVSSLAKGRGDARGLEPIERGLQTGVVANGGTSAREREDFVRCRSYAARCRQPCISRLNNLTGRPDENV